MVETQPANRSANVWYILLGLSSSYELLDSKITPNGRLISIGRSYLHLFDSFGSFESGTEQSFLVLIERLFRRETQFQFCKGVAGDSPALCDHVGAGSTQAQAL